MSTRIRHRHVIVVVVRVHVVRHGDLAHVADIHSLEGCRPCLSKDREENGGQDRDNRDDDEKLNERESSDIRTRLTFKHVSLYRTFAPKGWGFSTFLRFDETLRFNRNVYAITIWLHGFSSREKS